jgi:phage shock protein PspC (stress-responsive transcriptional regulator)
MKKTKTQMNANRHGNVGREGQNTLRHGSDGHMYNPPAGPQHHYHYPYKKLFRSRSDKWLGGVCGGLARYFETDPLLIRLLWIVVTIFSMGVGIIAYILFWIFVKKEPSQYKLTSKYITEDEDGTEHHHYHYKVAQ